MSAGRIAALFALTLWLGGCSSPPPPDTFYRLQPLTPATLPRPVLPGVVEVTRFGADGLTGDRALLYSYRDKPDQLLRYSYHLWTEAPPTLLRDQLVEMLRRARAADRVVTADLRVPPDYVVEGRLRRFEQLAGSPPGVVVTMDLGVVQVHGNQLLMLNTYHVEKPATSEQPADAVVAFQAAVDEAFTHFLHDLRHLSLQP